jgi:hypothetical protein
MKKTCGTCEFAEWVEYEEDEVDEMDEVDEGDEADEDDGEVLVCHRFPPQGEQSSFPEVDEDDWCGEWKVSKEKN